MFPALSDRTQKLPFRLVPSFELGEKNFSSFMKTVGRITYFFVTSALVAGKLIYYFSSYVSGSRHVHGHRELDAAHAVEPPRVPGNKY